MLACIKIARRSREAVKSAKRPPIAVARSAHALRVSDEKIQIVVRKIFYYGKNSGVVSITYPTSVHLPKKNKGNNRWARDTIMGAVTFLLVYPI